MLYSINLRSLKNIIKQGDRQKPQQETENLRHFTHQTIICD
ncbi:MAG: hypothetical protein AAGA16_22720 [Cyanobacteria bacterium P01_E01_bin.35]